MKRIWSVGVALAVSFNLFPISDQIANAVPTWTLIYENSNVNRNSGDLTFDYSAGYEKSGNAVTNFSNSGAAWDLIRIRIQFTKISDGQLYWVDAYFDKWSGASLSDLQFPDHVNALNMQKNVTNLVVDSNYSSVSKGSFALGRIEFWPYNYSGASSGITPASTSSDFDWDDTPAVGTSGHGSYQLFNLTDTQTVFAWNRHRYNDVAELGFGTNTTGSGSYDWTFNATTFKKDSFKVQVYVGLKLSAGAVSAPTYSGNLVKGAVTTLTATASGTGFVTFYYQSRRIAKCIKRPLVNVSGTMTATCPFKPTTSGSGSIYAKYESTDSSYTNATSASVLIRPLKRVNSR